MDKVIEYIYETYDYDKFKLLEGNRNIDHADLIARSMDEEYLLSPICVNEKFEIIDGQNRYVASKMRHLPIRYYFGKGYGVKQITIFNRCSRNWVARDYISYYASIGKKDYVQYISFMKRHPSFSTQSAKYILQGSCADPSGARGDRIKNGTFSIPNLENSERIAKMVESYAFLDDEYFKHNQNPFVMAIVKLSRFKKFDNEVVLRKIRNKKELFLKCANADTYIKQFEHIINYRSRSEIIHFDFDKNYNPIQ